MTALGVEAAPFVLVEPSEPSDVIVEVPHAGLLVDARSGSFMTTQVRCLAWDADLHVDTLFARTSDRGAALLVARMSRHIVDLNGVPDADLRDETPEPERRIVYRHVRGLEDRIVEAPIPRTERARRHDAYFVPYHAALAGALAARRARSGRAVLLCAHSWDDRVEKKKMDLILGTRGGTSASEVCIAGVERVAAAHGLSTRRDVPFAGGYTTQRYGRPSEGVHAVQLEIARRLYLDPKTLEPSVDGVARLQAFTGALVAALVELAADLPASADHSPA